MTDRNGSLGWMFRSALLLVLAAASCADDQDAAPAQPAGGTTHTGGAGAGDAGQGGAPHAGSGGSSDSGGVPDSGSGGTPDTGSAGEPATGAGGAPDSGGTAGTAGGGGLPDPPTGPGFEFEAITLPNVSRATDFRFIPGRDDEMLVLSHDGGIHHLRKNGNGFEALGSSQLEGIFYDEGCGLLSFAFDPAFAENHYVYLAYCTGQLSSRLSRHVFGSVEGIPDSGVEILEVATDDIPDEDWHRFGSMGFEPDGETLWALLGDSFIMSTAQDTSDKFGSLLRIVPSRDPVEGGYEPASGNAFDEDEGDPSIFAYGFRSPWRGTLDSRGRYWVGDVGLVTREEVNLVTEAGQNFGWSVAEGPCTSNCDDLVDPKAHYGRNGDDDYDYEDPEAEPNVRRAVWVGDVYDSPSTDRYFGFHDDLLIFGDFFMGWVRGLRVDADGELTDDVFLGHLPAVTSFRVAPDGYMYALTLDGVLQRALPLRE
jgi:hypothetical protein